MKKLSYYVAAFALCCGVSQTLTSCIETEEPESVKAMREAEANRLNQEAEKAKQEALSTAQQTAEATAKQDLMVKAQEITNGVNQLALDKDKDEWDLTKADQLAAKVAGYQQAAKQAKLDATNDFLDSKLATQVANYADYLAAEAALDQANADLETASAKLTDDLNNVSTSKRIANDFQEKILVAKAKQKAQENAKADWTKMYTDAADDGACTYYDFASESFITATKKDVNATRKTDTETYYDIQINKAKTEVEIAEAEKVAFEAKTFDGNTVASFTTQFGDDFAAWQQAVEDQAAAQAEYDEEKAKFDADFAAIKKAIAE
ncbi:MAG: hypothetical protein IKB95_08905 [Bacteroidales bacterium]|nr:hypothetical protein [Bacteroidales bacterium]